MHLKDRHHGRLSASEDRHLLAVTFAVWQQAEVILHQKSAVE